MSELKILIVDDSLFFREVLARGLNANLSGNVQIEKAGDPFEARDKILSFDPDVMILVERGGKNGASFNYYFIEIFYKVRYNELKKRYVVWPRPLLGRERSNYIFFLLFIADYLYYSIVFHYHS